MIACYITLAKPTSGHAEALRKAFRLTGSEADPISLEIGTSPKGEAAILLQVREVLETFDMTGDFVPALQEQLKAGKVFSYKTRFTVPGKDAPLSGVLAMGPIKARAAEAGIPFDFSCLVVKPIEASKAKKPVEVSDSRWDNW